MNPIKLLLLNLIYRPIFNTIVVLLAIFWWNLGVAIIMLTIIVRLLLLSPTMHATKMQKDMVDIQPRLKELKEKYKDDPQKLWEETMKLFKTNWNPLKWCLMMFIQLPVFLWLFYVIKDFALHQADPNYIYSFLYSYVHYWIDNINHIFFGVNLFWKGQWANMIFAIVAGILMYIQIKLTMINKPSTPTVPNMPWMPKIPDMTKMMEFMNMFMIFMMMSFVYMMPAWIRLYIITSTLFTIIQNSIQYKELLKIKFMQILK